MVANGTFRLIATSASTAALEGEADMAGNGPKTTFMTQLGRYSPIAKVGATRYAQKLFSSPTF
jgi:hypothetical protein